MKLKNLGCGTGLFPEGPYYAVKMPVFSFSKLTDVDTALGPEMKSTGEVLGVDRNFHQALLKAFLGTGMTLPGENSRVLLTVRDEDKAEIIPIAMKMCDLNMKLYATGGTYEFLTAHGIDCIRVNRIAEGRPSVLDIIQEGGFDLVVNTPGHNHSHSRAGFLIRRAAAEHSVPVITAVDTAHAVIHAITMGHAKWLRPVDMVSVSGNKQAGKH